MSNIIRYKRQELLEFLARERVFGDTLALSIDMEFLKDPKSNPDTVLDCYLTAIGKLGYKIENLHQASSQVALSVDPMIMSTLDDSYWIRNAGFISIK